jgi:hypothetical protein
MSGADRIKAQGPTWPQRPNESRITLGDALRWLAYGDPTAKPPQPLSTADGATLEQWQAAWLRGQEAEADATRRLLEAAARLLPRLEKLEPAGCRFRGGILGHSEAVLDPPALISRENFLFSRNSEPKLVVECILNKDGPWLSLCEDKEGPSIYADITLDKKTFEAFFTTTTALAAEVSKPLHQAPDSRIKTAIDTVYDHAERNSMKPPNINELPKWAIKVLALDGFKASGAQIKKIADEFGKRRGRVGVRNGDNLAAFSLQDIGKSGLKG